MTRNVRSRALHTCSLVVASLVLAAPATAATSDAIEVSPDGTVYSEQFDGLLAGNVLVPQDTATDDFSIRNTSGTAGYVRIIVTDVTATDPSFIDSSAVRLTAGDQDWGSVPLRDANPCAQVANELRLAPGDTRTLTAALTLGDLEGTEVQRQSMTFRFELMITTEPAADSDACFALPNPTPPPHGQAPQLGVTGTTLPLAAIILATALASAGGILMRLRRRRSNER